MEIERDKFFALTATMAGFWPNAACAFTFGRTSTLAARGAARTEGPPTGANTRDPALAAPATCAKLRR